jgi:hypothetical protein
MLNVLTIDVEDYYQVHAFSKVVRFEDWDKFECRIERNTDKILEILNDLPPTSVLSPIHLIPQNRSTATLNNLKNSIWTMLCQLQHRRSTNLRLRPNAVLSLFCL